MPAVLTVASMVTCQHGGKVQLTPSQTVLTVNGNPVLVQGDLDGKPISGCTVVPSVAPAPVMKPCLLTTGMTSGAATKLRAGGKPALLETAAGMTDGVTTPGPTNFFKVQTAGQIKLTAI